MDHFNKPLKKPLLCRSSFSWPHFLSSEKKIPPILYFLVILYLKLCECFECCIIYIQWKEIGHSFWPLYLHGILGWELCLRKVFVCSMKCIYCLMCCMKCIYPSWHSCMRVVFPKRGCVPYEMYLLSNVLYEMYLLSHYLLFLSSLSITKI